MMFTKELVTSNLFILQNRAKRPINFKIWTMGLMRRDKGRTERWRDPSVMNTKA